MLQTPFLLRPRSIDAAAIAAGSGGIPYVIAASAVAVATTGDTNENTLATITIPGGAMGANGIVRITTVSSHTNSGNTKILRIKYGGTTFASLSVTTSVTVRHTLNIFNRNATNSQVGQSTSIAFGTSAGAATTASINTTAAVTILITGQNGLGSETITLESYLVEVIKG